MSQALLFCRAYQGQKREATSLLTSPLLGGGYLRLPMPQTIGAVTLRTLCQERDEERPSRFDRYITM